MPIDEAEFGLYPSNDYGLFSSICVHGVRDDFADDPDADGTCCIVDDANPNFWSIYGTRLFQLDSECLGDFGTKEDAIYWATIISQLHGIPFDKACAE